MEEGLYLGDCLDLMGDIEDRSVDMVLADLPYGVLNKNNPAARWDCPLPYNKLWTHYERIVKPNGAIVLFAQGMFTADLMESNRKMWRYNLIWKKGKAVTGFLNAKRAPLRNHEDICVFYKKQPTYNPQMVKGSRPHGRSKGGRYGGDRCYGLFERAPQSISDFYYPRSVLDIPKVYNNQVHPNEKPVDLLRYLIRTYSNEGELVLDNTCGSGSTCVAAILEHRRFIGIEKDLKFYDIAAKRIEDAKAVANS